MFKRSKYSNKKVVIDGHKFDSKVEAQFYVENKRWITELQPKIYLTLAKVLYKPDFKMKWPNRAESYVDVKGAETTMWRLKRRLWKWYGPGEDLEVWKMSRKQWVLAETVTTEKG